MDGTHPCVLLRLIQRIGPGIENVDCAAFEGHTADERAGAWTDSHLAFDPFIFRQLGIPAGPPIFAVLVEVDAGLIGVAQTDGGSGDSLKHGSEVEGRSANNFQHLARRGLVFQRFFEIPGTLP